MKTSPGRLGPARGLSAEPYTVQNHFFQHPQKYHRAYRETEGGTGRLGSTWSASASHNINADVSSEETKVPAVGLHRGESRHRKAHGCRPPTYRCEPHNPQCAPREASHEFTAPFRHLQSATQRERAAQHQRAAWLAALTPLPPSPTASQHDRDLPLAQKIALRYSPSPSPSPPRVPSRSQPAVMNNKRCRSPLPEMQILTNRHTIKKLRAHARHHEDDEEVETVGERRLIKQEPHTPPRPTHITYISIPDSPSYTPVTSSSRLASSTRSMPRSSSSHHAAPCSCNSFLGPRDLSLSPILPFSLLPSDFKGSA
ncbi:hypothetical protein K438DRAFT_1791683 [Mycena galopus ATCC 62051]|nr:hypothetical protein K438DRAFT_1791683 [Mycena galopus ATCC 62051]